MIGEIATNTHGESTDEQKFAWGKQIEFLKASLAEMKGWISFEMSIPRMGNRIDTLLIIDNVVFVLEFKVNETKFHAAHISQVLDYALDLKCFHEPSHTVAMAPILISTEAEWQEFEYDMYPQNDGLIKPILTNADSLRNSIKSVLSRNPDGIRIDGDEYLKGAYHPTPTIIEAAQKFFGGHSVDNITRSDAAATNLTTTTDFVMAAVNKAKSSNKKIICFVTGVPGAGKTLVGLNIAAQKNFKVEQKSHCVYLSGNGPLVAVLQEALAIDQVEQAKAKGERLRQGDAKRNVKPFIQIVHHFRDEYLKNATSSPFEHVAIFDEAQRAWNKEQTVKFMKNKKGVPNFDMSEPEFLISCMDRHADWAVIVCLVGEGQEIHVGEEGISGWIDAISSKFKDWEAMVSPHLRSAEHSALQSLEILNSTNTVIESPALHLNVSMRSFRAQHLTEFVHHVLLRDASKARDSLAGLKHRYPIRITRDLDSAKAWLRTQSRGSERSGMVVSSSAHRLKPLAIDVRAPVNPVHYFLKGKDDVRSSYYLEDAATEFQVQGLELDWVGLTWDADLRYDNKDWKTFSFVGTKWQRVLKEERRRYLVNAYRVLLTRARQGMIIVVPEGDEGDPTRDPAFYNDTYNFLTGTGIEQV